MSRDSPHIVSDKKKTYILQHRAANHKLVIYYDGDFMRT